VIHSAWRTDRGSAILEFQALGLLLLVPLVYVLMAGLDVQRAMYGVTQAAREAGRVAATTGAEDRARAAATVALRDQGLDPAQADIGFGCAGDCGTGAIRVTVSSEVALPYLPDALVRSGRLVIPVRAVHDAPVDRYAAR
jgi:Flp pilus assembly protein TadG